MANDNAESAPEEVLVDSEAIAWIPVGEGVAMKVLRYSSETGHWSALIKMEAGRSFAAHKHLGPADFYVLQGAFGYRGGTARAGFYGYEPIGAYHEATTAIEDTIYTFNSYGPIGFTDADGNIVNVMSWEAIRDLARSAEKAA
jgi:anti-sigma factor ChrR (cupin superfamily)